MCAVIRFSVATPAFAKMPIEDEREYLAATNILNLSKTLYLVYSTKSAFSPIINIKGYVIPQNQYVLVENNGTQSTLKVPFFFSRQTIAIRFYLP